MRPLTIAIVALAFFAMVPSVSVHAEGDYLDIQAKQLKVQGKAGPLHTVEVGQPVSLHCDWVVDVVDKNSIWRANGKEWKFPVRILVDNMPVGNFEGKLGPRTQIGKTSSTNLLGQKSSGKFDAVSATSGPATWVAKDPGDHQAVCVVNQPKQMSDRFPGNNTTQPVTIRVAAKKALALPLLQTSRNKSCRPFLVADLGINPGKHFSDPKFGPAEVPKRELVLFLRHSEAAGNYVNCRYESKNRDVENFVVNVPCKGAVPVAGQQHMYSCNQ